MIDDDMARVPNGTNESHTPPINSSDGLAFHCVVLNAAVAGPEARRRGSKGVDDGGLDRRRPDRRRWAGRHCQQQRRDNKDGKADQQAISDPEIAARSPAPVSIQYSPPLHRKPPCRNAPFGGSELLGEVTRRLLAQLR